MRGALLLFALALGANAARADDSFYVGAGISRDKVSDIARTGTSYPDIDNTSWKLYLGFRPIGLVAIEADYLHLGSADFALGAPFAICTVGGCPASHADARAFATYAVGFLPIPVPFLDVFGKAGLARWTLDASSTGGVFAPTSFSNDGTDFAWGIGGQVHFGNFGARLEYENFRIANTNGAHVVSLEAFVNIF